MNAAGGDQCGDHTHALLIVQDGDTDDPLDFTVLKIRAGEALWTGLPVRYNNRLAGDDHPPHNRVGLHINGGVLIGEGVHQLLEPLVHNDDIHLQHALQCPRGLNQTVLIR